MNPNYSDNNGVNKAMTQQTTKIAVSSIILDEDIYPRLEMDQKTVHYHLGKMPVLAFFLNGNLSQGFTVAQVAQKHGVTP